MNSIFSIQTAAKLPALTERLQVIVDHAKMLIEDGHIEARYLGITEEDATYVTHWNDQGSAIEVRERMPSNVVSDLRSNHAA